MQGLSNETKTGLSELAGRYQLSESAVLAMLVAVKRGHGTMAQFDIDELGGNGQWMRGGMTMVGDMFNSGLKTKVDDLCNALAQALSSGRIDLPGETAGQSAWWPQWLGVPSSTGAQNDGAYAVFPSQKCLAIRQGTGVTLYDTADHLITGVGQQQGANTTQTFSSQRGSFSVSSLRRIDSDAHGTELHASAGALANDIGLRDARSGSSGQSPSLEEWSRPDTVPAASASRASVEERLVDAAEAKPAASASPARNAPPSADGLQVVALIEKLAALRSAGILTDDEFAAKKAELLGRL